MLRFVRMGRSVSLDDQALTRHRWFGDTRVPWSEIRDYRLALDLMPRVDPGFRLISGPPAAGSRVGVLELGSTLHHALRDKDHAAWRRIGRITVWLRAEQAAVSLRCAGLDIAVISEIVHRVHSRLAEQARRTFDATGTVRFGPLLITRHAIGWKAKPLLERAQVEAIELFDAAAVQFRAVKRAAAWPYASAPLRGVPNLPVALEIARWLDYPVRGLDLLDW
jgi:hypothetical protein